MYDLAQQTKIKIVLITPTLQCGGSEKFVSLLCNHINTQLFSVHLVVLDNSTPFYSITNPAIEITNLNERRVRYALFKIKKLIREIQPAIVFSAANHLSLYLAIFKNLFSNKIKFIARESSIVSINNRRAKMPAIYNRLIKKYYRRFDFIICQSAYMMQDLVSNYHIEPEKSAVIHNATGAKAVAATAASKSEAHQTYKFITVARLSPEKGIERLIHALGLLSIDFTFYIIGDGERRSFLQNLVNELQLQEKIIFKGEAVAPFLGMEDADLFLMGSYYEGFPNTLIEAGAYGIPAVAFNAPGGISEIITNGENGLLVEDNNLIDFAAAINRAVKINFNRQQIIENTKNRFSVNSMLAALEQLFIKMS